MATRKRVKRSNGEGSVFPDPERGGYIGLIYLDGKRRKVRAKTRTDALAKLAGLQRQAATGIISDGTTTVSQLLDLLLAAALFAHRVAAVREHGSAVVDGDGGV